MKRVMTDAIAAKVKRELRVSKVVDAPRDLLIQVIPDDIIKGIPKQKAYCAIARAIEGQTGVSGVVVGRKMAYLAFAHLNVAYRYVLDLTARAAVKQFDSTRQFAPGMYKLCAPGPSDKLGYVHRHKNGHKSGKSNPGAYDRRFADMRVAIFSR